MESDEEIKPDFDFNFDATKGTSPLTNKKKYTKTGDDDFTSVTTATVAVPTTASPSEGKKKEAKDGSYASVVPFSALCNLFEHASKQPKSVEKKRYLQKFLANYHDEDYFPVMRMLLPQVLHIYS